MIKKRIFTAGIVSSAIILGGCNSLPSNPQISQFETPVNQVMTEYSGVLECLGGKIEAANVEPVEVYIREIEDETVPFRFRERRLSKGAAWWFHTAIGKLETDKVSTITKRPSKEARAKSNYIEISGAWTQDDAQVGVSNKNIGFDNLNGGILDRFGWFDRDEWSVIAGDFVSTVNGRVVHSSAISLSVKESGQDYNLRIEDGSRRFDFGLRSEANEGPQFAQRRIVEAATLVHISHTLDIDYSACVKPTIEKPEPVNLVLQNFTAASQEEQHKLLQQALTEADYDPGPVDGIWGEKSRWAMIQFQVDNQLVPSGNASADMYLKLHNKSSLDS